MKEESNFGIVRHTLGEEEKRNGGERFEKIKRSSLNDEERYLLQLLLVLL